MEISAKELSRMASDVDDLHREAMRTFRDETAELHLSVSGAARRRFLAGAGAGGAALAVGAAFAPATFLSAAAAQALDDGGIAAFAQSVELAAVAAYGMAAAVLTPATLPVGMLFAQHHQEHANAFGALAGDKATGTANAALLTALTPTLQGLDTEAKALEFAFGLELQAAETYAFALTALENPQAALSTATILPIEMAHAGVLGVALGKDFDDLFPTGAFVAAAVGDGRDIEKGLDPAAFPVA